MTLLMQRVGTTGSRNKFMAISCASLEPQFCCQTRSISIEGIVYQVKHGAGAHQQSGAEELHAEQAVVLQGSKL